MQMRFRGCALVEFWGVVAVAVAVAVVVVVVVVVVVLGWVGLASSANTNEQMGLADYFGHTSPGLQRVDCSSPSGLARFDGSGC